MPVAIADSTGECNYGDYRAREREKKVPSTFEVRATSSQQDPCSFTRLQGVILAAGLCRIFRGRTCRQDCFPRTEDATARTRFHSAGGYRYAARVESLRKKKERSIVNLVPADDESCHTAWTIFSFFTTHYA